MLSYAAPVYTPLLSNTSWAALQVEQNAALRAVTGCVRMTSIAHLHHEAETLPVREHSEMLSKQFLVGAHLPERADHHTTEPPTIPPRKFPPKRTLLSAFGPEVADHTTDLDNASYRRALATIHRETVASHVRSNLPPLWESTQTPRHPLSAQRRGICPGAREAPWRS